MCVVEHEDRWERACPSRCAEQRLRLRVRFTASALGSPVGISTGCAWLVSAWLVGPSDPRSPTGGWGRDASAGSAALTRAR